jgi:hypothetical protein
MCKAPPGVAGRAEAGGDGGGLQQASPAAKIHAVHEAMRGHLRKSSQVLPSPPTHTRLLRDPVCMAHTHTPTPQEIRRRLAT